MAELSEMEKQQLTEIEARIEAVAQAYYNTTDWPGWPVPWHETSVDIKDDCRNHARRFLAMYDAAQRFPLRRPDR